MDISAFEERRVPVDESLRLTVRRRVVDDCDRYAVFLHGLGEHAGRYLHVGGALAARGWNVVIPELRGHGLSEGVPTHIDHFDEYLDDVGAVFEALELPAERTVLMGHSMGGLVAARFAQTRGPRVGALALFAPLLRLSHPVPPVKRMLGSILYRVMPRFRFRTGVRAGSLTSDETVAEQRRNDPLLRRSVTCGWYFAMLAELGRLWSEASGPACPLFIAQGALDPLVDPTAPEQWVRQMGHRDAHVALFPEHLHELLNEGDWEATVATVDEWLSARIAPVHAK